MAETREQVMERLLQLGKGNTPEAEAARRQLDGMVLDGAPATPATPLNLNQGVPVVPFDQPPVGPVAVPAMPSATAPAAPTSPAGPAGGINTVANIVNPPKRQIEEPSVWPKIGQGFFALTGNQAMSNFFGNMAERERSQFETQQLLGATRGVFDKIRSADLEGAMTDLDAVIDSGQVTGAGAAHLFNLREYLAKRTSSSKSLERGLTALNGQTLDTRGVIEALNKARVEPNVILSLAPHLKPNVSFTWDTKAGGLFKLDNDTGKVDFVAVPQLEGAIESNTKLDAAAAQATVALGMQPMGYRQLFKAASAKDAPPELKLALSAAAGVETYRAPTAVDTLDAAVMHVSGGKYQNAAGVPKGSEGAGVMDKALRYLQSLKPNPTTNIELKMDAKWENMRVGELPEGQVIVDSQTGERVAANVKMKDLDAELSSRKKVLLKGKQVEVFDSMKEVRGIVKGFDQVVGQLATTPGGNIAQKLEFMVKSGLGIKNPGTTLQAMEGSILRVAKAMQGAAAQLSDKDRDSVTYLIPKGGDSQAVAEEKLRILRNLLEAMDKAALGQGYAQVEAVWDDAHKMRLSDPNAPKPKTQRTKSGVEIKVPGASK